MGGMSARLLQEFTLMPGTVFGNCVMVAPSYSKFRLSETVPLSDNVRQEIQGWLDSFFGKASLLEDFQVLIYSDEQRRTTFICNEATYELLKNEARRREFSSIGASF